jgi:RNA-directed DNA polymerase
MQSKTTINKIHSRLEDYNSYFYGSSEEFSFQFNQRFFVYQLLSIIKLTDLKVLLKTSFKTLDPLINCPRYYQFSIPKKRGGDRVILVPEILLRITQSRLNFYLQNYYHSLRPQGVYGFVINPNKKEKYCNIVENAKMHVQKKHVFNLDLKDFFPSILAYRVKELFQSDYFRYNDDVATTLAFLVTYKGKLPIGAPTSPVISNFICLQLDADFNTFCKNNSINYSRYADDLTFSSNIPFSEFIKNQLFEIIRKNGFQLNPKKTRLKSNNRKQTVTGLVVNEKVNVNRKMIKMVRAMLYDAKKNGIVNARNKHFSKYKVKNPNDTAYFLNRLNGYINFIAQVRGLEDKMVVRFKTDFQSL